MGTQRLLVAVFTAFLLMLVWGEPAAAQDDEKAAAADRADVLEAVDPEPGEAAKDRLQRDPATSGWLCCPPPKPCCPRFCPPEKPLIKWKCFDGCLAKWRMGRATSCLQIEVGAYHWWNADFDRDRITYGLKADDPANDISGTYFYYLKGTIECPSKCCTKFGAHVHARFRENTAIRPFMADTTWLQEAYAYVRSDNWGIVKVGKVIQQFGQYWNESFWGNTAYFNGLKLNPEWGVSAELQKKYGRRLVVPLYVQGFIGEDGVSGSFTGGDAESSSIYDKEWTAIVRVEPRYYFAVDPGDPPFHLSAIQKTPHVRTITDVYASYVSFGLSALVGGVSNSLGSDETRTAFAVDASFEKCGFRAYAEYAVHDGVVNEAHYATFGPSDRKTMIDAGVRYRSGAFQGRVTYSRADYENPGGEEQFWILGLDVHLLGINPYPSLYVPHFNLSALILTIEYVYWTDTADLVPGTEFIFQDALQIVLNWNL